VTNKVNACGPKDAADFWWLVGILRNYMFYFV